MVKYADDTNVLVPADSDIGLLQEFNHVNQCQVSSAVLLGVTLCDTLSFTAHVDNIFKICSQRLYLLKLLRDQGLPRHYLNAIFDALVLSKLRYAICVWSGFLSTKMTGQINAFLKRAFKYGFCNAVIQYRSNCRRSG